jgi:Holliday junction resolvase RusA-like endonuclease
MKPIKLTFQLPPTDNHIYGQRGRIRFMFKEAKDWKENAKETAAKEYKGQIQTGDISAKISFYLKRARDIQGSLKLLFDALEGVIYENDSQIKNFSVVRETGKDDPRIEITLT